jgi:hypothetical protein
MPEGKRRRSRVLEYFEQKAKETPESGGDENPFQDLDAAFGLDGSGTKGDK